jgi:hypothetical protein
MSEITLYIFKDKPPIYRRGDIPWEGYMWGAYKPMFDYERTALIDWWEGKDILVIPEGINLVFVDANQ